MGSGQTLEAGTTFRATASEMAGGGAESRGVVTFPRVAESSRIIDIARLLEPGAALTVSHVVTKAGALPQARVALASAIVGGTERLETVLATAFPGTRFGPNAEAAPRPPLSFSLLPERFDLEEDSERANSLTLIGGISENATPPGMPVVSRKARHPPNIEQALSALSLNGPVQLDIRLSALEIGSRWREGLVSLKERLLARAYRLNEDYEESTAHLQPLIRELLSERRGTRMEVRLGFWSEPNPFVLDVVCNAFFGCGAADESIWDGARPPLLDLRGVISSHTPAMQLLPSADAVQRLTSTTPATKSGLHEGDQILGMDGAEQPVALCRNDQNRHVFVLGSTGTGKSTLMLNMLAQDFATDEAVILLDPHGDLADDARRLVPKHREADLIFAEAGADDGTYKLNIFTADGGDPDQQGNQAANALVDLFVSTVYTGVNEAFGPIFDSYFRNAFLLIASVQGENASLIDFDRLFGDQDWLLELLGRCTDQKVFDFWTKIALRATDDHIALKNVAPFIVAKLTRFTGSPFVRRVVSSAGGTLDFSALMNQRKIVILKVPASLGRSDAELISALTILKLSQAAMGRAAIPRNERRPCKLYVDEIQSVAGDELATLVAEARKYGLALVMATQGLGRIDGRDGGPDVGSTILANAANLVSLRLGSPDAARVGPWFAPDVDWDALCRLPDHHAFVRILDHGRPMPATMLRLAPPPSSAK